jgi:adenylate kinase
LTATRREVVLITGTPGTGKTVIAKQLSGKIHARYIPLTRYVTRKALYSAVDPVRRTKIVDLSRVRRSLENDLAGMKGWIVVDTHISEGAVPKRMVKLVIVLRCHPKILETRLRKKRWTAEKRRENVLAEILDSCLVGAVGYYGAKKVVQMDTSTKTVRKCGSLAERALMGNRSSGTKRDWLRTLQKERLLDRFLT